MIAMASFTYLTAEPGGASGAASDMATTRLQQRNSLFFGLIVRCVTPGLVGNFAIAVGLVLHAGCWCSLISPASLGRSWIRSAGTGKGSTSGSSPGARRPMPWPWWLHPRSLRRGGPHADSGRGEHGVGSGGELRIRVPDQVGEPVTGLLELAGEVAGELGGPAARGCAVIPGR